MNTPNTIDKVYRVINETGGDICGCLTLEPRAKTKDDSGVCKTSFPIVQKNRNGGKSFASKNLNTYRTRSSFSGEPMWNRIESEKNCWKKARIPCLGFSSPSPFVNTSGRPRRSVGGVFIKQKQNVSHASAMFFSLGRKRRRPCTLYTSE